MKRVFIILIAILGLCYTASAQNIRLGEKIPEINVESVLGSELRLIDKDYTCLIFMHSQCEPCVTALPKLYQLTSQYDDKIALVLLTSEAKEREVELLAKFGSYVSAIAFDNNRHTYRSFGINFVPFAVIYNTNSRRIEWFGSTQQIDATVVNDVCKLKR
jgi:thiol-disulfide isomerase/thioredoxin